MPYSTAREFFEAAREAARDAERIARQLAAARERANETGSAFESRVRSTPDPDRIGRAVAAILDREEMLHCRREDDLRLVGEACAVLYGYDGRGGLFALVGWRADAISCHYLQLMTWEETADLLGYSQRHVLEQVAWAFDLADANGLARTRAGIGGAT